MLNVPAPPLHCDYYFPTPQTAIPVVGPMPPIPVQGQLSVLFFDEEDAAFARRLQRVIPRLAITVVSRTTGLVNGRWVLGQPEQEARLRHQYLADSLKMPGAFCVTTTTYHMTAQGHAIPSPDPNTEAYHMDTGRLTTVLVSSTGLTLNNAFNSFGLDLEWFLQRLQEKSDLGRLDGR
jgi:hypothetical protein